MNFSELVNIRQSCRSFDKEKKLSDDLIETILSSALLAPSACNSQPYKIFVCVDDKAKQVAVATQGMGMNKFTADAPVQIVIAEDSYNKTAAIGAKMKNNDYRSIDIGILASHIVNASADSGVSSCILGWFDSKKIQQICETDNTIRLVISLGYASEGYQLRNKKRKPFSDVVKFI